ncbi:hypothetical protein ESCOCP340M_22340 [Escherichia coli]|uniref:hypothetical protein n=1 Tax=Escherichia sp. E4694 TaxID=2044464 RepID=UPI00108226DA|nr:hypothetical protein [Escherichia sp. E4694]TGB74142.1 hypothetical protein CRI66_21365 [Escherichia sp. E4694]HCP4261227.1 hypothetical protein [Escherichia coli]
MKSVILILKGKKPEVINVGDGLSSINWMLSDDTEVELEIITANVTSLTGESSFYLVATDIEDLDSRQIRQAVEILSIN